MPIPGTKRVQRVEENTAALDIELTAEELTQITDALPEAVGTRY